MGTSKVKCYARYDFKFTIVQLLNRNYVIIFTNIIPYFPSVILFSFSVAIYHPYDRSDIMINTGCRLHNNECTEKKCFMISRNYRLSKSIFGVSISKILFLKTNFIMLYNVKTKYQKLGF